MQKHVMSAFALAVVSLGAQAQSSLTVYGVADAGLVLEHGGEAGSVQKVSSGVGSSSRLGFKGREDLGDGTVLTFVLENGYSIDTGAAKQNGALFGRQALLCLSGAAGALSIGHQYTPFYKTLNNVADPFTTGLAGNAQNVFDDTTRVDNTVEYITPRVAGFSADVQYGFGESAGDRAKNRYIGASATYEQGPLTVVLAHQQRDNASATAHSRNTMLVGRYKFGDITGHLAHARNRDVYGNESHDSLAGFTVQLSGANHLIASYIDHHDSTTAQKHARQAALGFTHGLSRRTDLYAAYGHIRNSNGALFRVGTAADSGSGTTGINLGVRHVF
ncbi:porin [Duganella sp. FT80W]|uniref:Porin n=1 Tax=Duganella guangzhouensis TaxID=2666084 RepID=A0A6I2KS90_9BURK|nr:porin [Duganella guangzhouensis]MRW88635.1 porin [Duganella guangzhouensis]